MDGRIEQIFSALRASDRRALMPFVCGGFPTPGTTARTLAALDQAGASVIEVGLPFSDPIADGPVIASAMHDALKAGSTPRTVLDEIARARGDVSAGIVAMVSMSIVHRMGGPAGFAAAARERGVDGLIVPDVPLEESEELQAAARDHGLTLSLLIAPTTPFERAAAIAQVCTGFVYMLARSGITGERGEVPDLGPRIRKLRTVTDLPIACGFGISTPDHVGAITRDADAAIVGSAIVRHMREAVSAGVDPVAAAVDFTRDLVGGLAAGRRGVDGGSDTTAAAPPGGA